MRKFVLLAGLLALAAVAAAGVAVAGAKPNPAETVLLDTYNPHPGAGGTAASVQPLQAGVWYGITASGTWSAWAKWTWTSKTPCGSPVPVATPSPNTANGLTAVDAETVFAWPGSGGPCPSLPEHQGNLTMNLGSGYFAPAAQGGPYSAPTPDHTYTFDVQGQGAPVVFRNGDSVNSGADNYGVLTFDISPLTTDACKDGGWQTFGSWKNQGDCVSYIASDGASGGS